MKRPQIEVMLALLFVCIHHRMQNLNSSMVCSLHRTAFQKILENRERKHVENRRIIEHITSIFSLQSICYLRTRRFCSRKDDALAEDVTGIKLSLPRHELVPSPAEVMLPMALREMVRQVLLRPDTGTRGSLRHPTVAKEDVIETLGGAGGQVG